MVLVSDIVTDCCVVVSVFNEALMLAEIGPHPADTDIPNAVATVYIVDDVDTRPVVVDVLIVCSSPTHRA